MVLGISYWILPAFAGTVWLGTLAAMLGWWLHQGSPHYYFEHQGQKIAFISDVGATELRPLFIAGSATTVAVFDLAFIAERWLRRRGRLAQNYSKAEAILSVCSILASIVGGAGLILLTIFDTKTYPRVHDAMLGVFIVGYIVSAIFICAEYQRLGIHFREYRILRMSFWIKLFFILLELALVIAFGVLKQQEHNNPAAVIEWIIALIYIFYVYSFIIDFLPAIRTRHHEDRFPPVRRADDDDPAKTEAEGSLTGGPVYTNGGYSSQGSHQPMTQTGNETARNF